MRRGAPVAAIRRSRTAIHTPYAANVLGVMAATRAAAKVGQRGGKGAAARAARAATAAVTNTRHHTHVERWRATRERR